MEGPLALNQETIELEVRKIGTSMGIGRTTLESLKISVMPEEFMADRLMVGLQAYVMSHKLFGDKYTAGYNYKVYSSWWQHFKHDYTPLWFRRRYPIEYQDRGGVVEVVFDRYATYPKADIALRRNERFYNVQLGGLEVIQDEVRQTK